MHAGCGISMKVVLECYIYPCVLHLVLPCQMFQRVLGSFYYFAVRFSQNQNTAFRRSPCVLAGDVFYFEIFSRALSLSLSLSLALSF